MAKPRIGQDPAEFQARRSAEASAAMGQTQVPAEVTAYLQRKKVGVRSIPTPGAPPPEPEVPVEPAPVPFAEAAEKKSRSRKY